MARQISMESALEACEAKLGQLTFQNVLLKMQLDEAEAELEQQSGLPNPPSAPPGTEPPPAGPAEIRETEAKVSGGASRPARTGQ